MTDIVILPRSLWSAIMTFSAYPLKGRYHPRSRGQEEPRDFCSGEEPSYDLRPYSAMMLPRKL
jgi:hypothetical protein